MAHRVPFHIFMVALAMLLGAPANAALVISDAPTANVTCQTIGYQYCGATAANAVLNVRDLEAMLRQKNAAHTVEVSATTDLIVASPLEWVSQNTLIMAAPLRIKIDAPITVLGTGGIQMFEAPTFVDGLSFGTKGSIAFWDLNSPLQINGVSYTLVYGIFGLASAVSANPAGNYALSRSYDAAETGTTYYNSPVLPLSGSLEGLGNTISNFTLVASEASSLIGLIAEVNGTVRDLRLMNANVTVHATTANGAGVLTPLNNGTIAGTDVSGTMKLLGWPELQVQDVGSVAAANQGQIVNSSASVAIFEGQKEPRSYDIGGLVGVNRGNILGSWATGTLHVAEQDAWELRLGGLVGLNNTAALVERSWARMSITDNGNYDWMGGLVGENLGHISASHADARLATGRGSSTTVFGGLVGVHDALGIIDTSYATGAIWDDFQSWSVGGLVVSGISIPPC